MPQTRHPFFDDLAQFCTQALDSAQGLGREVEDVVRAQLMKIMEPMHMVSREEFEAVREMAQRAREENARLAQKIEALEKKGGANPSNAPSAPLEFPERPIEIV